MKTSIRIESYVVPRISSTDKLMAKNPANIDLFLEFYLFASCRWSWESVCACHLLIKSGDNTVKISYRFVDLNDEV